MDSLLVGKQLSVKEAAARLGCGRDSVLRAIRSRKLRAWKLDTGHGRRNERWLVPESELVRYVERNLN